MRVSKLYCVATALILTGGLSVATYVSLPTEDAQSATVSSMYQTFIAPVVRLSGHYTMPDGRGGSWRGSGVVVYSELNSSGTAYDSYVLTCNHCVLTPVWDDKNPAPAPSSFKYAVDWLQLFSQDGSIRKITGTVVAHSENNIFQEDDNGDLVVQTDPNVKDSETGLGAGEDLALIKLDTVEKLQAAKMMPKALLSTIQLFKDVRIVGCSLGGKPYHTSGEITLIEKTYFSANAPFCPGNSGGACYLADGTFIGITNAGIDGYPHLGIIRPLDRIYSFLEKENHAFIFDRAIPRSEVLASIRSDLDKIAAQEKSEIEELRSTVASLKAQFNAKLQENEALCKQLAALAEEVRLMKEKISKLESSRIEPVAPSPPPLDLDLEF
jgi:hypothetical protein